MSDNNYDSDSSSVPSWMDICKEPLVDSNDNEDNDVPEWLDINNDDSQHIVTPNSILKKGLEVVRYDAKMLRRCRDKTNLRRFKSSFGVSPETMCRIYEDIQSTDLIDTSKTPPEPMYLKGKETNLKWLLRAFHYLKKYPTGDDVERELAINEKWGRTKIWETISKIQFLKHKKITWEDELGNDNIWIMTVDGTHVWIHKPSHPEFSQDSDYFSHKFNKAGIDYELGIAIASQRLIWMNGPFPAGKNDLQIFKGGGLRDRLKAVGKKAIGDGIYRGNQDTVSYPNSHDSRPVHKFKSRALKRHKGFNGMTKCFQIL